MPDDKKRTSLNDATNAAMTAAPGADDLGDDIEGEEPEITEPSPAQVAAQKAADAVDDGTFDQSLEPPAQPAARPAPKPAETAPAVAPPAAAPEPDPFAEFDTLEYEDDDGTKVPYRVPKALSKRAKNAMTRTNIMSRATYYGSKYKPLLDPIIQQGRMDTYADLISLAESNEKFAQAVMDIAQRVRMGLPITAVQQQTIQAAAATAPAEEATDDDDIFGVGKRLAPIEARMSAWDKRQKEADEAAARQRDFTAQAQQASVQTYNELRMRYPDEFTGDQASDSKKLEELYAFANSSGHVMRTNAHRDPRQLPAAILGAKLELDNQRLRSLIETSATPAAATIAAIDAAATHTAREAGRALAAATAGGTTSAPGVQKTGPVSVSRVDAKGRRLSAEEYGRRWAKANEASSKPA